MSGIVKAASMIAKGYYNKIIEIETGVRYREILSLRQEMADMGIMPQEAEKGRGGRITRKIETTVSNKDKEAFASVFASIYSGICEKKGASPAKNVDIDSVEEALTIFRAMIEGCRVKSNHVKDWGVNEAYMLAREIVNGTIVEKFCPKCRTKYFQIRTSTGIEKRVCHFCRKNKHSKK